MPIIVTASETTVEPQTSCCLASTATIAAITTSEESRASRFGAGSWTHTERIVGQPTESLGSKHSLGKASVPHTDAVMRCTGFSVPRTDAVMGRMGPSVPHTDAAMRRTGFSVTRTDAVMGRMGPSVPRTDAAMRRTGRCVLPYRPLSHDAAT
jgi:hypothetical protein